MKVRSRWVDLAETIVCPECGAEFDRPRLQQKRYGFGFGLATLAGKGDYQCPKCSYKGRATEFATRGEEKKE
jgi:rubredoxin